MRAIQGRAVSGWLVLRACLLALVFFASAFAGEEPSGEEPLSAWFLLTGFIFGIVGLLLVIGVQTINPLMRARWRRPAWTSNPFQMKQPLQFFHFAGFFMLAAGAGTLAARLAAARFPSVADLLPLVFGLGILCGVTACTIVYRDKMESGPG